MCVCWVIVLENDRENGRRMRFWEAFCQLQMHTITQAAVCVCDSVCLCVSFGF